MCSSDLPLLHVRDAATAILRTLTASAADVRGQVFNVGVPGANYSLAEVADVVRAQFPQVAIASAGSPDRRSYTVCFDRFGDVVGELKPPRTVEDGVAEVAAYLDSGEPLARLGRRWGPGERSSWLASLLADGVLAGDFRWRRALPTAANL